MAHVVIMGAGIGGMPAAYEMRDKLDKSHRVTVISDSENFHFTPSNPWVGVKWRDRKQTEFPARTYLERTGIDFFSTGPKLAFEEIEGLGPHGGHTYSVCHVDHAMKSHDEWEHFCENPGPIVVGAVQGASCFGPSYEYAFIMDTDLRKRKVRNKVPMTF